MKSRAISRFTVGLMLAITMSAIPLSSGAASDRLSFKSNGPDQLEFNTGTLMGNLGLPGKGNGLSAVSHLPSGLALDRGANGHGLLGHYRVFANGKRFGTAAWDWPRQTRLREDGAAEINWASDDQRPFKMRAVYRWLDPATLDVSTEVYALKKLSGFEVFLASYFTESFTHSAVLGKSSNAEALAWQLAEERLGIWQMFPRDASAVKLISDGRWTLPPHPVDWKIQPPLAQPMALRRAPHSRLTALLVSRAEDCFAIAMPHQTEGHFSVYFSLGGRDLPAGETLVLRAGLILLANPADEEIQKAYRKWIKTAQD